ALIQSPARGSKPLRGWRRSWGLKPRVESSQPGGRTRHGGVTPRHSTRLLARWGLFSRFWQEIERGCRGWNGSARIKTEKLIDLYIPFSLSAPICFIRGIRVLFRLQPGAGTLLRRTLSSIIRGAGEGSLHITRVAAQVGQTFLSALAWQADRNVCPTPSLFAVAHRRIDRDSRTSRPFRLEAHGWGRHSCLPDVT